MKKAATLWVVAGCLFATSAASAQCVGDCNGDGVVAINELITGVNIALDPANLSQCPSFDVNDDSMVAINELIAAVNNALGMCIVETERTFTLDPGRQLASPGDPATCLEGAADGDACTAQSQCPGGSCVGGSGLFTSGLSGGSATGLTTNDVLEDGISPGPLTLVLGAADAEGVASLRLKEDVFVRFGIIDGSYLCFNLLAAESDGTVDCDGGTAYDTKSTQPAGDVGFPFDIETNLGAPAGPGNGDLLVPSRYEIVRAKNPDNSDNPDFGKPCNEITYVNPLQTYAFTTTKAISDKGGLILEASGEPFDCASFSTPGSGGRLAAGAPATQAPAGDVANVFRFGERAP